MLQVVVGVTTCATNVDSILQLFLLSLVLSAVVEWALIIWFAAFFYVRALIGIVGASTCDQIPSPYAAFGSAGVPVVPVPSTWSPCQAPNCANVQNVIPPNPPIALNCPITNVMRFTLAFAFIVTYSFLLNPPGLSQFLQGPATAAPVTNFLNIVLIAVIFVSFTPYVSQAVLLFLLGFSFFQSCSIVGGACPPSSSSSSSMSMLSRSSASSGAPCACAEVKAASS